VLSASYGLYIHEIDVETTFLYGELDEDIYIYIWSSRMIINFLSLRTKCANR
jgi:hypothetical protein